MGTHLIVLSECYLMHTNMTGLKKSKIFVIWMKEALVLEVWCIISGWLWSHQDQGAAFRDEPDCASPEAL